MPVIFASPAGTGKTSFKEQLKKHFGCNHVYDDAELHAARGGKFPQNALILCQSIHDCKGIRGRLLTQVEMNAAMVAVSGRPIWNANGSVNSF